MSMKHCNFKVFLLTGKFFKTHNITNNKKTLIPPPQKKKKPSLGTYALQGILFHLEHLWLA